MTDCIFCKIVRGEIPCTKVYEDDAVLAFDDIHPAAPVHVVIIPKQHIPTLMDVDVEHTDMARRLFAGVQAVAKIKKVDESGFRLVANVKSDGTQLVYHLHMHLIGGHRLSDRMC